MKKNMKKIILSQIGFLVVGTTSAFAISSTTGGDSSSLALDLENLNAVDVTTKPLKKTDAKVNHGEAPKAVDITLPVHAGFVFKFLKAKIVNDAGESTITYEVSKAGVTGVKEMSFVVSGFETANQRLIREVDISTLDEQPTKKANRQVFQGANPTAEDINMPVQEGFTFGFSSAKPVDNNGISNIVFSISKAPDSGFLPIAVSGFETLNQKELRELKDVDLTTLPSKAVDSSQVLNGFVPNAADVSLPVKAGFTFEFVLASPVNDEGKSKIAFSVNKGLDKRNENLEVLVGGFETLEQKQVREVTTLNVDKPPLKVAERPAIEKGKPPSSLDVSLPIKKGFNFKFKSSSIDEEGKWNVKYKVTKGEIEKELEFLDIKSSLTTNQEALWAVTKSTLRNQPAKADSKNVLNGNTPVATDFTFPEQDGFQFAFLSATPVNGKGETTVTFITTSSKTSDTKHLIFTIGGFESSIDKLLRQVDSETLNNKPIKKANRFVLNGKKPTKEDIKMPSQLGFDFAFKEATIVNANGQSTITFTVSKESATKDLEIEVDGFETLATANKRIIDNAIKSLSSSNFNDFVDAKRLASSITKNQLITAMKNDTNIIGSLNPSEKSLFVEESLSLAFDDIAGSLKIAISNHGFSPKIINLSGFKVNTLEQEVAKMSSFESTDTFGSPAAILEASEVDIKEIFKSIQGLNLSLLSENVMINKAIVKTALNITTSKVVYELTFSYKKQTIKSDVTVTFAPVSMQEEIKKLINFTSPSTVGSPAAVLEASEEIDVKDTFKLIQGFDMKLFSKGTMISQVIVKRALDSTTRQVVYEATLAFKNQTAKKQITITFAAIALDDEANKFVDFVSNDSSGSKAAILARGATDIKDEFMAIEGFTMPELSQGVEVSKVVVDTALNPARETIYQLTLSDGISTITKNIKVTFARIIFETEVAKIVSFQTSLNSKSELANLNADSETNIINQLNSALEFGELKSRLAHGVTIKKAIVKSAFDRNTRQAMYTLTFGLSGESDIIKDITITFAHTLEAAIQALQGSDLVFINEDISKSLASFFNKTDIVRAIKASKFIKIMSQDEKDKLSISNIIELIPDDNKGTLEFTITGQGSDKTLAVSGFKIRQKEDFDFSSSEGLSTEAIVGISAGTLLGVSAIAYLVYFVIKNKWNK